MMCRAEEARGGHDPYKSLSDRQREEKRREVDRKMEADRQKVKEVRAASVCFLFPAGGPGISKSFSN